MKKLLLALAAVGFAAYSTATLAAGEIGLIKAESRQSQVSDVTWANGLFKVQVSNLGYDKKVFAHIKRSDGSWTDYPLFRLAATGANKEIWFAGFSTDYVGHDTLAGEGASIGPVIEFALKYQVNGQTYWDNNGNANYKLVRGAGSLLGRGVNVSVTNSAPEMGLLTGFTEWKSHITLRNIALAKNVKVVYTTDNWATTKVVYATYRPIWSNPEGFDPTANPNSMGFEEWDFSLPVTDGTTVEYAIAYTVNGQTYWDNNFGSNYRSHFFAITPGKRSG